MRDASIYDGVPTRPGSAMSVFAARGACVGCPFGVVGAVAAVAAGVVDALALDADANLSLPTLPASLWVCCVLALVNTSLPGVSESLLRAGFLAVSVSDPGFDRPKLVPSSPSMVVSLSTPGTTCDPSAA